MAKGQFKIQKLMAVGTSNPIVAALTMGLDDIIQIANISKANKGIINTTNFNIVQNLTKAEKIGLRICGNINLVIDNLNKTGIQTQSCERCINLPSTDGLDDIREFLKYCKQSLQELVKIINLFCDTGCTNPRYDKISIKLREHYGENNPLFLLVKHDHDDWLKKLLDLRNADEHPENNIPTGKSLYYDFDINWSDENKKWIVEMPHFFERTSVYDVIKTSIHNILTFAEEINILLLEKHMPTMVQICKVPDDQQSRWGGRRYITQLKPPFYPKGEKSE